MQESNPAQLTLFPEVFLASLSVLPGSEEARKMTATSGQKCLELSSKSGQLGLLEKMLLTSQIWNSTERFLTWKARDTKHGHLYYQLVPSMPRTSGSEHSLWPTPTASDTFTANLKSSQQRIGSRHSVTLPQVVRMFWLTPTATDGKRASQFSSKSLAKGKVNGNLAQQVAHQQNGSLNPAWVEWLMGYPIGWTE